MKPFELVKAKTVDEAAAALRGGACVIAGGTDLVGRLKDNILPDYPEALVDITGIPGLDGIAEEGGVLRVGALARLADIAASPLINEGYTALAEAAGRAASPNIRNMATLGGNVAQLNRCWYFRKPENRFHCLRKGAAGCFAKTGDNRFHSVFGDDRGCYSVSPSDTAPALITLGAMVVTNKRVVGAEGFFAVGAPGGTVLEPDEIITGFRIKRPAAGAKSAFLKMAWRKSIDFPVVNCAVVTGESPVICLGAVAPTPYRAREAEAVIAGILIDERIAAAAGAAAVSLARPLPASAYKAQIAQALVKRALLIAASR